MSNEDPIKLFDWFYDFMTINRIPNLSDDRVITAYHEAGHIIIAHNCNLGFDKASLHKEDPRRGQTELKKPIDNNKYEDYACYMMAGIISQYIYTYTINPEYFLRDYIRLVCHKMFEKLGEVEIKNLFEATWNYFVSIIDNDVIDNKIIKAIVCELLMKGVINNDRLNEIISDLNSPTNSADIILPDPYE